MVRKKDISWNYVNKVTGGRTCAFCEYFFKESVSVTRIRFHLAGETGNGVKPCTKVPKDVKDAAYEAAFGANDNPKKKAKTTATSSNDNGTIRTSSNSLTSEIHEKDQSGVDRKPAEFLFHDGNAKNGSDSEYWEELWMAIEPPSSFPPTAGEVEEHEKDCGESGNMDHFHPDANFVQEDILSKGNVPVPCDRGTGASSSLSPANFLTMPNMLDTLTPAMGNETAPYVTRDLQLISNVPDTGNVLFADPPSRSPQNFSTEHAGNEDFSTSSPQLNFEDLADYLEADLDWGPEE